MKAFIFTNPVNLKTMKNIIMAIFLFAGIAVNAQAKMEFKTEVIDYGEIQKGADGLRTFVFTNVGDAPLDISRVSSSCGCTVPKKPENPILPGETGEIQVKYDTGIVGPIRKTITVYSNADVPAKSLKIKGKVLDN